MKKFFQEFKDFVTKGNVLDLAVGMIIGAAFNAIVKSMVNDMLMPVISLMFKGDVGTKFLVLKGTAEYIANADTGALELVKSADAVLLYWGQFLQSIIDFLIIGFTLFVIVKTVIKMQKISEERKAQFLAKHGNAEDEEEVAKEEPEEEVVSEEVLLLREIRDSLQKE